ncbi:MAG: FdrA family protein [Austwickia sp.]|nr:FdrA family protein [Austwickia sp.]
MTRHVDVRSGAYYDSVSLMQVSRTVRGTPGVSDAMIGMGTELNVGMIRDLDFDVPSTVTPNDLVIAIRADDEDALAQGLAALDQALAALKAAGRAATGAGGAAAPPRTMAAAAHDANLAFISVPGAHAFNEAMDAVESGMSVMLFSDNVPIEQEVALKKAAAARDVLVMGPDCGTAVVSGVALGFANKVRSGSVGLVAASGTGAQQVMCLLDAAGVGMSHCLGVGGRDLSAQVGGRSTRQALGALDADPDTEAVLIVSKPADPGVLSGLEEVVANLTTPVYWATLGQGRPDLTESVEAALRSEGVEVPNWAHWPADSASAPTVTDAAERGQKFLRGIFVGGTLADEAMLVAGARLGPIRSNIPLSPELALPSGMASESHTIVDMGDDEMTRGRPHPMIDPTLRMERIAAEAADPSCGVLLLDLVLGYGSHPDPAGELAEAIRSAVEVAAAAGRRLPVVVALVGVEGDPQGLSACAATLAAAGADVYLSNAAATRRAVDLLEA